MPPISRSTFKYHVQCYFWSSIIKNECEFAAKKEIVRNHQRIFMLKYSPSKLPQYRYCILLRFDAYELYANQRGKKRMKEQQTQKKAYKNIDVACFTTVLVCFDCFFPRLEFSTMRKKCTVHSMDFCRRIYS